MWGFLFRVGVPKGDMGQSVVENGMFKVKTSSMSESQTLQGRLVGRFVSASRLDVVIFT